MPAAPKPLTFDVIDSRARLRAGRVEIVLVAPQLTHGRDGLSLRLTHEGARVNMATELRENGGSVDLVASAPRRKLTDGTWALILVTAGAAKGQRGRSQKVDGRLLVQGRRPLVLLWGVADEPSITPVKKTVPPPRQRAAAAAGRGLDKALSVLPPERAASMRERVRATARRVLP